jgi:hypothetical protein
VTQQLLLTLVKGNVNINVIDEEVVVKPEAIIEPKKLLKPINPSQNASLEV